MKKKVILAVILSFMGDIILGETIVGQGNIMSSNPWWFYSIGGAISLWLGGVVTGYILRETK